MSARIYDNNGWYEIPDNPLSRVGVFDYLGSSISAPEPNKIYKVYRPASELANPETLNSFRLVPFVIGHKMLGQATQDGIPAEKFGVHGVIGDNVWFDHASEMMRGNVKVFSATADADIERGKIDLSLGYVAKYFPEKGSYKGVQYDYVQRNIKGNHVALVLNGRMGKEISVLDDGFATFDMKDVIDMIDQATLDAALEKALKPLIETQTSQGALLKTLDEKVVEVVKTTDQLKDAMNDDDMEDVLDAAGKPVMDAEGKPMKKKKEAGEKDPSVMDKAAMDAAIKAAVEAAVKPLNEKIVTLETGGSKKAIGEIATRDELAVKLSFFVGSFDHKEMTVEEVAKYAVKKLEIPTVDGQEIVTVKAWLHGRVPARASHTVRGVGTGDGKSSVDKFLSGAA